MNLSIFWRIAIGLKKISICFYLKSIVLMDIFFMMVRDIVFLSSSLLFFFSRFTTNPLDTSRCRKEEIKQRQKEKKINFSLYLVLADSLLLQFFSNKSIHSLLVFFLFVSRWYLLLAVWRIPAFSIDHHQLYQQIFFLIFLPVHLLFWPL